MLHNDEAIEWLKGKRIIFALLANQEPDVLAAQLNNIHHYNPNAGVILYNGGTDPTFGESLGVCLFPRSHPIAYGNLAPYLWEVMQWLEELQVEYDYLVNLDHDILFLKPGFEAFLDVTMREADCMGWGLTSSVIHPDSAPIRSMLERWPRWQSLFGTKMFYRYFNPGQVYKREIVTRMLHHDEPGMVSSMLTDNPPFALEETFFVSMVHACGGRIREYPDGHMYNYSVRWGQEITAEEAEQAREHPSYYWVHPVKGQHLQELNHRLQHPEEVAREAELARLAAATVVPEVRAGKRIRRRKRVRGRRAVKRSGRRRLGAISRRRRRKLGAKRRLRRR
ncbi:hypothetical protein [Paenibacillus koleovorans]|uniref:hypothetical protein n=1 Tax=Paenibacillus koleovorans TaxID=121608 RepID=UPI000FD9E90F|nr:hypothetical protein [Paenibacillus koleovorans]